MLPVGPLMIEHRLIERMIALMAAEAGRIDSGAAPDTEFIRTAVDFVRHYADTLHHGKEEAILFRELARKPLDSELGLMMAELVRDHVHGRALVRRLVEARERFLAGEGRWAGEMAGAMRELAEFYPRHIAKEDKRFFLPVMSCFSEAEQAALLAEFSEFDRGFVHAQYRQLLTGLDGKRTPGQGR